VLRLGGGNVVLLVFVFIFVVLGAALSRRFHPGRRSRPWGRGAGAGFCGRSSRGAGAAARLGALRRQPAPRERGLPPGPRALVRRPLPAVWARRPPPSGPRSGASCLRGSRQRLIEVLPAGSERRRQHWALRRRRRGGGRRWRGCRGDSGGGSRALGYLLARRTVPDEQRRGDRRGGQHHPSDRGAGSLVGPARRWLSESPTRAMDADAPPARRCEPR
jgi:hypothetical protein